MSLEVDHIAHHEWNLRFQGGTACSGRNVNIGWGSNSDNLECVAGSTQKGKQKTVVSTSGPPTGVTSGSSLSPDPAITSAGYQTAVGLATFYANIVWSVFNTMLVANSIVVASMTVVTQNAQFPRGLVSMLCLVGVIICLCWLVIVKRAHEFAAYYTLSAREIEEAALAPTIQTLSRGGVLANGNRVTLNIAGSGKGLQLSVVARFVSGQMASIVIVIGFIIVYILVPFLP